MGSKKKPNIGIKKKKNTKTTEGRCIGAALLPAAAFAAVPRLHCIPTPTLLRRKSWGLSSALLNSGVLSQMFGIPNPDKLDKSLSDSDTSLFEYVSPRDISNGKNNGSTGSHGFGGTFPGPPAGFGDSDSDSQFDSFSPGPESWKRSIEVEAEITPVQASAQRSAPRGRTPSPSSLRHSGGAEPGPLLKNTNLRSSGGSLGASGLLGSTGSSGGRKRRSLRGSPVIGSMDAESEVRIEGSRSSLRSSIEKTLTRVSTDLSHTGSLRLNTLREQNAALMTKQSQLEEQMISQRQLQEQLMGKLKERGLLTTQSVDGESTQDVASLVQETHSATDMALNKQEEMVEALKQRIHVGEEEKKELIMINEQLRMEIVSLGRIASARDDDDSGSQSGIVKKLKEERDTLQAMIIKSSAELSRYHARFRPLSPAEVESLPGLPTSGPKPSWLVNHKYLAPLFVAYDDQLAEKDAALESSQAALDDIRRRVDEVVRENQRLHIRLEQTDGSGGPVGMTEWRSLQEQCKLVLEENQLLMEQLDVQQHKVKDMHKAHVHEVSKMSKRLVVAEAQRSALEQEVVDIRERLTEMKKEHTEAVIENKARLGVDEHTTVMSKFQHTIEEERTKHALEIDNITTRIQNMTADKKGHQLKIDELKTENQNLTVEIKALQRAHKKSQKKIHLLQKALEDAEVKEQTAGRYLSSIIRVAEKTAKERDSFVEVAQIEQRQKKAAMNKILEGNVANTKMEEKLKVMRSKASEKLEKAAYRMREQDDDFSQQRREYEREIKHLRLLIRERQELLDNADGEKRHLEDDLEVMWQVATEDNRRMKDTVQKSIRKLKDHASLRIALDAEKEQQDLLLCDSDVEK